MHSAGLIGIGIVGLGYWGPNHVRVVMDSPRARLKSICDTDPTRLERFAGRTTATPTANLDDLLESPDIDAIIVSTPISTHHEIGTRALDAGKHVLIEKPLAQTSQEADQLIALGHANGLAVMCGHTFLFSPPVIEVKKIIESGDLGEIYFITSSRVNLGLHQRDVSVLWDLAPHDFSILGHWLETVPDAIATNGRDSILAGTPDVAFVSLNFADGLIANIELSWLAPSKLRRTTLVGAKRMVVYEDNSPEQVRIYDRGISLDSPETFGEFQLSYRTGGIYTPKLSASEPMATQFDAFVDAIEAGASDPTHTSLARDVVAMIEAAEASLEAGGRRVPVAGSSKHSGQPSTV